MKDDLLHGKVEVFDENGILQEFFTYKNDLAHGLGGRRDYFGKIYNTFHVYGAMISLEELGMDEYNLFEKHLEILNEKLQND